MNTVFCTGYPESSNITIESDMFNEYLKVNSDGYSFTKKFTVPPGTHIIKFTCDAQRIIVPSDPRELVFTLNDFKLVESR